jgi:hypothetical protein
MLHTLPAQAQTAIRDALDEEHRQDAAAREAGRGVARPTWIHGGDEPATQEFG